MTKFGEKSGLVGCQETFPRIPAFFHGLGHRTEIKWLCHFESRFANIKIGKNFLKGKQRNAMMIRSADRLKDFPVYLFDQLDRAKAKVEATGAHVIDLGVGDPDKGTPKHIVEALCRAAQDCANHHYPSYKGIPELREAIASWYEKRHNVALDPDSEVLALIGSKGGIGHLPSALVNPGEIVLIGDPCYPAYKPGIILAGGETYSVPLLEENKFLPDLKMIPAEVASRAKIMLLNYPNNPTAAVATVEFFNEVTNFARKHEIIVAHDVPYSQSCYDGYRAPSFLETSGGKEVGVEFNSLSKTYNMTGWRIAFAVGNPEVIAALGKVKSNVDMGIFEPIQYAGVAALTGPQECVEEMRRLYEGRRDVLVEGLRGLGWPVEKPKATFFVWMHVPEEGTDSASFASKVLERAHVVITPGIGFGRHGEGYVRVALTVDEPTLEITIKRLRDAGFSY